MIICPGTQPAGTTTVSFCWVGTGTGAFFVVVVTIFLPFTLVTDVVVVTLTFGFGLVVVSLFHAFGFFEPNRKLLNWLPRMFTSRSRSAPMLFIDDVTDTVFLAPAFFPAFFVVVVCVKATPVFVALTPTAAPGTARDAETPAGAATRGAGTAAAVFTATPVTTAGAWLATGTAAAAGCCAAAGTGG